MGCHGGEETGGSQGSDGQQTSQTTHINHSVACGQTEQKEGIISAVAWTPGPILRVPVRLPAGRLEHQGWVAAAAFIQASAVSSSWKYSFMWL